MRRTRLCVLGFGAVCLLAFAQCKGPKRSFDSPLGSDSGDAGYPDSDADTHLEGGNPDGANPDAGSAMPCGDRLEDGCSPSEASTVFVDPNAPPGGVGTRDNPVNSAAEALAAAKESGATRAVICRGTVPGTWVLDTSGSLRELVGGFHCDTWKFNASVETRLLAAVDQQALEVSNLSQSVAIRHLKLEAPNAELGGGSSIAARVVNASDVLFEQVQLVAGNGADGPDGSLSPFEGNDWPTLSANNATSVAGGAAAAFTCPGGGTTTGGRGGETSADGHDADPGGPEAFGGTPGSAGISYLSTACSDGGSGSTAAPGEDGAGAEKLGTLADGQWLAEAGADAKAGGPGGGGGGGGQHTPHPCSFPDGCVDPGQGGSGGPGGCGGNGGGGGKGGGASIALLAVGSKVTLVGGSLIAGAGGNGGDGAEGELGQLGILGGTGQNQGCKGGRGGNGGAGGKGGGGAGGLSVAILFQGTSPTLDKDEPPSIVIDAAGAGGLGSSSAEDGVSGCALQTVDADALPQGCG